MNRMRVLLGAAALALGVIPAGAQTQDFCPVTDAMLANPDPSDWLQWRRTYDTWGYSPLNQINKTNVNQLQLVWSWGINPGASEEAPLVHDGVMFIPNPGRGVQAVNAVNGDFLSHLGIEKDALDGRPIERHGVIVANAVPAGLHHRYARI